MFPLVSDQTGHTDRVSDRVSPRIFYTDVSFFPVSRLLVGTEGGAVRGRTVIRGFRSRVSRVVSGKPLRYPSSLGHPRPPDPRSAQVRAVRGTCQRLGVDGVESSVLPVVVRGRRTGSPTPPVRSLPRPPAEPPEETEGLCPSTRGRLEETEVSGSTEGGSRFPVTPSTLGPSSAGF